MYLSIMHFKWTNVVCLSMDMLISLMMDVVIISAKLVCHLCFICKLNYLFGAHMCYGGVTAPVAVSSINSAVVQYLYWFLMSWVHGVCWWGHSKIHKNDTSKALQCTHHIVLLGYATIKLANLKFVNDTVTSIIGILGKLWRILSDMFKCTMVELLTCAITFQHQWLLCSALDWGKTCGRTFLLVQSHFNTNGSSTLH